MFWQDHLYIAKELVVSSHLPSDLIMDHSNRTSSSASLDLRWVCFRDLLRHLARLTMLVQKFGVPDLMKRTSFLNTSKHVSRNHPCDLWLGCRLTRLLG